MIGLLVSSENVGIEMTIRAMWSEPRFGSSLRVLGEAANDTKESAEIAMNVAASLLGCQELKERPVVIQIGGLTEKSGDSAATAMTIALYGLAQQLETSKNYAVTGTIDLDGNIKAIGGVLAKSLIAFRSGRGILLPEENRLDFEKLDKSVKESSQFHFVSNIQEAIDFFYKL